MTPAHFIRDIKREYDLYKGNLVYPGKLMGYVGLVNIMKTWQRNCLGIIIQILMII